MATAFRMDAELDLEGLLEAGDEDFMYAVSLFATMKTATIDSLGAAIFRPCHRPLDGGSKGGDLLTYTWELCGRLRRPATVPTRNIVRRACG